MANEIEIAADSSDLKVAIGMLQEYEKSFVSMVNKVQTESNRMSRAAKATSDQVYEAFSRTVDKLNNDTLSKTMVEEARLLKQREQNWKQFFSQDFMRQQSGLSAKDSVFAEMLKKEEEAAKIAAVASKQLAMENEQLIQKYAPLTAAAQKYEKEVEGLNLALQRQYITAESHKKQLDQVQKEYDALGKGVYLAGSRFNQFGQMADGSGKSAQRFGMYAQQAGYQIGDFAVQVQSGTNVGVAFSQQAAQLAGLIPGLAGAITTFAAIGLGILIQNLSRSKKETKELETSLKDLQGLDDIFKSVGVTIEDSLVGAIAKVRTEYGELVADVTSNTVTEKIKGLATSLKEAMPKATAQDPKAEGLGFWSNIQNSYFSSTNWALQANKDATIYNETLEIVLENIDNLANQDFTSASQAVGFLVDQYEMLKESSAISEEQLKKYADALKGAGVYDAVVAEIEKRISAEEELIQKVQDRMEIQRREKEILDLTLQHGEKSAKVFELQKEHTLEILRLELERLGVEEQMIDILVEQEGALIDQRKAADDVDDSSRSILSTLELISGLDISGVFTRAKGEAYQLLGIANSVAAALGNLGKMGAEAKALAAENQALADGKSPKRSKLEGDLIRDQNRITGFDNLPVFMQNMINAGNRSARETQLTYQEENDAYTKAFNDANKKSKGGSKKAKKTDEEKIAERYKEFLDQMEIHMEQQESLIGLYGEQREKQEKIIEIENRLGDARHLASQKQIEAWAEEELALEKRLEREKQIYDTLNSGFEDFIMNVVGGTHSIEDAFKQMLSNMIKEMYNNLLAKPASNWLSDIAVGLLSAKGNAFGVGGVKMFAKGGVVDNPTPFGYSGGLGVMGEAGPEAIMPLKRNARGDLGVQVSGGSGGGGIVIHQTFQYSANGDESIRNIIKSSMPEISNRTKAAIIQAKARGEKGL